MNPHVDRLFPPTITFPVSQRVLRRVAVDPDGTLVWVDYATDDCQHSAHFFLAFAKMPSAPNTWINDHVATAEQFDTQRRRASDG